MNPISCTQWKYILVDDSAELSALFQLVWKDQAKDIPLLSFSNGTELINYFLAQKKHEPYIVILDLNMPEKNGIECLRVLRTLEMTKHTPIIIFSTSNRSGDIAHSYLSNATAYIQKPFDLEGYKECITSILNFWKCVIPFSGNGSSPNMTQNPASTDLSLIVQSLENLPNMVFVKDAKDLRFVYFNRAGEDLLGLSREILIGKNDYDFFPKIQADFFTNQDKRVLQSGKLLIIPSETIETANKGSRQLCTRKVPLFLSPDSDQPTHLLGISEDITTKK